MALVVLMLPVPGCRDNCADHDVATVRLDGRATIGGERVHGAFDLRPAHAQGVSDASEFATSEENPFAML